MKKILFALTCFIGLTLSLESCNEEIQMTGNFVETAVVFGLLNQADTVHYIKVTRAFIGPGNALEIAQIPDSNYFNSVTGTVRELTSGRIFTLRDTIVENKETNGVFYAPEQKLYYFTTPASSPLDENSLFRLNLDINNGAFQVSGETDLVKGLNSTITSQTQPFKFIDNATGDYKATTVMVSSTGNAFQINTTLEIEFSEWIGTDSIVKKFTWNLGEAEVQPNSSQSFQAQGSTFYELVKSNCTNNPAITKRTFNSITAHITGGSEELYNYILVNQPTSSLAQSKPTYTNLEATNGHPVVGVFSSRQKVSYYKPFKDPLLTLIRCIDKPSTQRLCTGSVTGPYLFCSDHSADAAEFWSCD